MDDHRIPVTLLTGFLGAGKTTLLNGLLSDASNGRIAVVVNEFGEAGLDHDLMESSSEDVVLMQSGCLCCSVKGDLAKTITSLAARRVRGELEFERVVIETTGLADPGPIITTLGMDGYLSRATRLDGVVTLVDAVNGMTTLDQQFEAVSQAAVADLIIISKTDLAAPDQVIRLEERLRGINPSAKLRHAVKGAAVSGEMFNLHGLRQGVKSGEALAWVGAEKAAAPKADPMAGISGLAAPTGAGLGAKPPSPHDARISSVSIITDDPLTDKHLDDWLEGLVKSRGPDLLRVKGIVFLKDMDMPFVFHGVQHLFDAPIPLKDWTGSDRTSRIVVIGRDISKAELQESFDALRGA